MKERSINKDIQKLVWVSLVALAVICMTFTAKQFFETSLKNKLAAKQDLLETVSGLETTFLMARRAEKDFLLRKDAKYVDRHAAVSADMVAQLGMMDSQARSVLAADVGSDMEGLRAAVDLYIQKFGELIETHEELGFDETVGLQANLRTSVQTAEAAVNEFSNPLLQVKILMMRRHEKDFIMRGDQKYVDRLNARVAEFQEFPTSEYPSRDVQVKVLGLIAAYQSAFNDYATKTFDETATRSALSVVFSEAEPLLQQLKDTIDSEVTANRATATNVTNIVLVGSIFAVLITAIFFFMWATRIARRVAKPWQETVEVIDGLADGTAKMDILKNQYVEVAEVATAFEGFHAAILEKEKAEQERREQARREVEEVEQRARDERVEAEELKRREQEAKIEQEREIIAQISKVVDACALGDFSQRLDMAGKEGIFGELCAGINQIAESTETNIEDIVVCIGELSQGNLGTRIDGDRQGAFLRLKDDFNLSLTTLSQTMAQIMQSGQNVSGTSSELESSSHNMAKRSEDNAAAVEETSAAIEQISASIRQVVENAKAANEATQKVKESAAKTREVSNETEASINEMTEASGQINSVVKVIEDIAFQINLLALNAGVEAARAGEAGRGFSVVASEVRALAQRSQEAVQEIGQVIEQNNRSVEVSVEKVGLSRQALESIVSEVEVASGQISEITTAVEQQAMGIDEVNTAIRTIDTTTQTNAAALEEMTASSVSLSEDAKSLAAALGQFRGVSGIAAANNGATVVPMTREPREISAKQPILKSVAVGSASINSGWEEF
ncbi:hypothetical protein ROLI_048350 (plasmid) [Roseobacter fucihabitans]|uniref:Methyl-accepting chemotaxis protein n=1 Tax=Roseobacter fucihabitans TaxID=1537242 RepID=A0ABZ2C122_9RHOB|nr:methyl-accepting chemotaxis protein [Roseobacter litoralis]MBC6967261.1 Methyl-accepting chemotaxis protein III [Roseobacter litoralis]